MKSSTSVIFLQMHLLFRVIILINSANNLLNKYVGV